jgi:HEPN domain-containing protein
VNTLDRSADWMEQAQGDLAHARNDVQAGFYDWACFSSQQAAEKSVKAVLHRMGAEAWGHSVADLLDEVRKSHAVSDELFDAALELDKAYIPARYPDAHASGSPRRRYTRGEAERMVANAESIVGFCESLLSAP